MTSCDSISNSYNYLRIAIDNSRYNFLKKHQNLVKAIFVSAEYAPSKRLLNKIVLPIFYLKPLIYFLKTKKTLGQVDYSKYKQTGDWNIPRMKADVFNTGLKSYIYSVNHAYKFNAQDYLKKLKIPILIIHGDKDTIFPIKSAKKLNSIFWD